MRTIVIVGAVVLSGAAIIGFMMNERNKESQASFSSQGIPQMSADAARTGVVDASGNPTLNPAHGQPGHRCDLAVGAPLSGDAKTAIPSAGMPTTTTTTTSQVNSTAQAAPADLKLNPAHGQPGHRCDISVGAPLNSTPSSTTVTPQTQNVKTAPVSQPAPAGLKTNPAHGQPGHRCDLAVGAPLTSSTGSKLTTDSIK